jgi:hypothetical protein
LALTLAGRWRRDRSHRSLLTALRNSTPELPRP